LQQRRIGGLRRRDDLIDKIESLPDGNDLADFRKLHRFQSTPDSEATIRESNLLSTVRIIYDFGASR
jgi:hypothetical protein